MGSGRGPPGGFGAGEVRLALRWAVRVLLVVFGRRLRDRRSLGAGRRGAARRGGGDDGRVGVGGGLSMRRRGRDLG